MADTDLQGAVRITGAATGKVITQASAYSVTLTAAQTTALTAFLGSLTGWPGQAAHVTFVNIVRNSGSAAVAASGTNPGQAAVAPSVSLAMRGLVVNADAQTAVNSISANPGHELVGQVP